MSKKAWIWCLGMALGVVSLVLMREAGKFDVCTSQYDAKTMTYSASQWEHRLAGSSIRGWYGEIYDPCSSSFIPRKRLEHFERTLEMTRRFEAEHNKSTLVKK